MEVVKIIVVAVVVVVVLLVMEAVVEMVAVPAEWVAVDMV